MRSIPTLLAAATLFPACSTLAAGVPKPAKEEKVCKTERSLSSRIVRHVCKTAAEWKNESMDARNKLKMVPKAQTSEAFKPPLGQ